MRVLGNDVAEVPLVCTRPELRGNGLSSLLLSRVEQLLLRLRVRSALMPLVFAEGARAMLEPPPTVLATEPLAGPATAAGAASAAGASTALPQTLPAAGGAADAATDGMSTPRAVAVAGQVRQSFA